MAKKSRVISHGIDYINLPKENQTYAQTTQVTGPTGLPTSTLTLKQEHPLASLNNPVTTTTNQTTTNPNGSTSSYSERTYQSSFNPSDLTNHYKESMLTTDGQRPDDYEAPEFETSALTNRYRNRMKETEDSRPGPYTSQYESTINDILDTIKNRKSFDVKNDANYNALYDQYAERYRANAQRAMNDAMASANAATGGYGSTYAQAVGQQAYDRTMEGLNDNNMALLNLAYDIYSGDRANDYNMLNAYQSEDNTQYNRYRDTVNDWQTDRNYYANQYQQNYANDRSAFENDRNFDYGTYRDQVADWQNDRNYNASQYFNSYGNDYTATQDEIKRDDANYQDALTQAMALAKEGLPVPSYITDRINQYNSKYGLSGDAQATLAQLAATALTSGSGSGGSGSGRKRGSGGGDDVKNNTITQNQLNQDWLDIYRSQGRKAADEYIKDAKKYMNVLDEDYTGSVGSLRQNEYNVNAAPLTNEEKKYQQDMTKAAVSGDYREKAASRTTHFSLNDYIKKLKKGK